MSLLNREVLFSHLSVIHLCDGEWENKAAFMDRDTLKKVLLFRILLCYGITGTTGELLGDVLMLITE